MQDGEVDDHVDTARFLRPSRMAFGSRKSGVACRPVVYGERRPRWCRIWLSLQSVAVMEDLCMSKSS